ncbi:hypothetical protein Goklo_008872 [Gossypium klotzschianum]|uniref:Uncharacterized protein n=1 Tax=Gossypium klotzschianum TaxID=34286 RepID=A0A7J8V179_9ROSI|nr:hypothetical protein [Gossypium klotzschianum]
MHAYSSLCSGPTRKRSFGSSSSHSFPICSLQVSFPELLFVLQYLFQLIDFPFLIIGSCSSDSSPISLVTELRPEAVISSPKALKSPEA